MVIRLTASEDIGPVSSA